MNKIFLLKIICLVSITLFQKNARSQQNFQNAYVVNINQDTIRGEIDYRYWEKTPRRIEFKKENSENKIFYKPDEITAFHVANQNYVSAIVSLEKSSQRINELDNSPDFIFSKDTVFLEALVTGNKPLYYLKDFNEKESFFIKGESGYELLRYKEYLKTVDGISMLVKNEGYKNSLKVYLQECAGLYRKIERMSYTLKNMQNLFRDYYTCQGVNPGYQKEIGKNKSEFGVLAGLAVTKLTFSSSASSVNEIANTNFPQSTAFAAGLFYNIYLHRDLKKLSINAELIYSSYKTDGVYEAHPNDNYSNKTTTSFAFSYIKFNGLVRYTFPVSAAFIYINAGMSNGLIISEKNEQKQITTVYTTETIKNGPALRDTRNYEQGYIIGLGTKYNHYSLEARFEKGNGMSSYSNLKSPTKRFYFLLGYRF
ncbi:MAG: hypothetical protein JWM28_1730 [Chitinophagaceae bacterium]|nr:hypothetical protein [Chitinophagaceae bacterium]